MKGATIPEHWGGLGGVFTPQENFPPPLENRFTPLDYDIILILFNKYRIVSIIHVLSHLFRIFGGRNNISGIIHFYDILEHQKC